MLDSPEWQAKHEKNQRFLRDVVYTGFTDINAGFDSPQICHFSPEDFLGIIDRCESLNVRAGGHGLRDVRYTRGRCVGLTVARRGCCSVYKGCPPEGQVCYGGSRSDLNEYQRNHLADRRRDCSVNQRQEPAHGCWERSLEARTGATAQNGGACHQMEAQAQRGCAGKDCCSPESAMGEC